MATKKVKTMTKKDIYNYMGDVMGMTVKEVTVFFNALLDVAYNEAKKGSFIIPGLGKLVLIDRKERMGRNPATGEPVKIKAKKVVKFRLAKVAKESILG